MILQLLRNHVAFPVTEAHHRGGLTPAQVRRVTDYMQGRLGEDIRLKELAEQVHLSRYHFCRAFRLSTGHSPHQWLVRLRMTMAARLLADMRLGITDVALSVGYQTASSFAVAFRNQFGCTPTDYRRRL